MKVGMIPTLKLSNNKYKKNGVVYTELFVDTPLTVFDTDAYSIGYGVMLFDGENVLVVPEYVLETFTKVEEHIYERKRT